MTTRCQPSTKRVVFSYDVLHSKAPLRIKPPKPWPLAKSLLLHFRDNKRTLSNWKTIPFLISELYSALCVIVFSDPLVLTGAAVYFVGLWAWRPALPPLSAWTVDPFPAVSWAFYQMPFDLSFVDTLSSSFCQTFAQFVDALTQSFRSHLFHARHKLVKRARNSISVWGAADVSSKQPRPSRWSDGPADNSHNIVPHMDLFITTKFIPVINLLRPCPPRATWHSSFKRHCVESEVFIVGPYAYSIFVPSSFLAPCPVNGICHKFHPTCL